MAALPGVNSLQLTRKIIGTQFYRIHEYSSVYGWGI